MDSDSADSTSQQCNKSSEVDSSPAKVPDTKSPAEVSNAGNPAEISNAETPANISNTEPPAKTSNTESPAKDSNTKPPPKVSNAESPANVLNNESPAKVSNTESPAKASNAEPPNKASNVTAPREASGVGLAATTQTGGNAAANESPLSMLSPSNLSSWAKNLKFPQPVPPPQEKSQTGSAGMSPFARFTSELGLRLPSVTPTARKSAEGTSTTNPGGVLESLTKGLVDTSRNAVKAVQVKARHIVSQNKRRYQVTYLHYCVMLVCFYFQ